MSRDKPEPTVRRPRAIAQPRLPVGALRRLKDLLYGLYLDAGAPSLDQITSWIAADDALPGAPERDTVRRCIGSTDLPANQHDVVSIAAVLARAAGWDVQEAKGRVRALWVEARLVVPLGQPVGEYTDAVALKVHPVIDAPGAPAALPKYLTRRHDQLLSEVLERAEDQPVMAVLVGGSSTGKTRAAFEAVHRTLPDWRLYHPIAPSKMNALIDALKGERLAARTVLWLDELREYLGPAGGEEAAARLHELLTGSTPIAVVATIWPDDWAHLAQEGTQDVPAPYPQARDLLRTIGQRIDIDEQFNVAELQEAAREDPRLRQAFDSTASKGQITQYLAAGFALIETYKTLEAANPGAWALLTAAMDAHRFGHPDPIPHDFLAHAVPRYLPREAWGELPDGWLPEALQDLTKTVRGAARPLTRIRPYPDEAPQSVRYQLADYLAQYARSVRASAFPPASFWLAAGSKLDDPAAQVRLGYHAQDRGRLKQAAVLQRNATRITDPSALRHWAGVLWGMGERAQAEECLQKAAGLGDAEALSDLAYHLEDSSQRKRVAELYEQAANGGDEHALRRLARHLWKTGERDKAETYYAKAVESGDRWARWWWATDLQETGERERVVELCELDALHAPPELSLWWGSTLFRLGLSGRAEELLAKAADRGNTQALWRWAEGIWEVDRSRAEELFRQSADAGDDDGLRRWANKVSHTGDMARASDLFLEAISAGDSTAIWWYAGWLWERGQVGQSRKFYILAANIGCWWDVQREWASHLRRAGLNEEARLLQKYGLTCDGEISDPWALEDVS
ncbi:hypothetical protein [Micromonospora chalcea]|uniref:hypothetical protein n=1 Tax=Micromonospora chalcea TaxID=1874 RepID=UPI003F49FD8B